MSGQIFLESDTYSFSEKDGVATIAIVPTGDLSQPVTVQFETVLGSAGNAGQTSRGGFSRRLVRWSSALSPVTFSPRM